MHLHLLYPAPTSLQFPDYATTTTATNCGLQHSLRPDCNAPTTLTTIHLQLTYDCNIRHQVNKVVKETAKQLLQHITNTDVYETSGLRTNLGRCYKPYDPYAEHCIPDAPDGTTATPTTA